VAFALSSPLGVIISISVIIIVSIIALQARPREQLRVDLAGVHVQKRTEDT
jgi:hypothetical protein